MKKILKYVTLAGLSAVMCLFMDTAAFAQHRGGGGGGHAGGGGFSGGGRSGGSFSGGSHAAVGVSPRTGGGFSARAGSSYRGGFGARGGAVRTNAVGVAGGHRGYVKGSAGGGFYGHGGGYYGHGYYGRGGWARHGGYFYYGGFYGSLYYPWLGLGFGFLPYGYYSFYWGGYPYYYSDGFFYNYNNDQYTVVEPPVGAAVNALPSDAKPIMIDGQQYYEKNGVYYQAVTKDDGTTVYEVMGKDGQLNTGATGADAVTPKVGDIVSQLPPDCRKVKLSGTTYYVSEDGIYYQEIKDENGNKAYKIASIDNGNADDKQ